MEVWGRRERGRVYEAYEVKIKGKNCFVIHIAGFFFKKKFVMKCLRSKKRLNAPDYTTQGRGGGREITRHTQEGGEGVAPIWNFLRLFHPYTVPHLGERLNDVGDDVVHADGHVDVDCLLYLNDLVLVHVPRHLDLHLNNLVNVPHFRHLNNLSVREREKVREEGERKSEGEGERERERARAY